MVKIVGHVESGNEKKEREAKDSMELTWAKHLGPINAATHDKNATCTDCPYPIRIWPFLR